MVKISWETLKIIEIFSPTRCIPFGLPIVFSLLTRYVSIRKKNAWADTMPVILFFNLFCILLKKGFSRGFMCDIMHKEYLYTIIHNLLSKFRGGV